MDYQIPAAVLFLQSQIYLAEGLSMVVEFYFYFFVLCSPISTIKTCYQLLLVQDGKLYGRDPMFSMITRAAGLPEVTENHDIQKNEFMVQLGQVVQL